MEGWRRYPKIPLGSCARISTGAKFVVTEKLHGANFSVLCDGTRSQFAKRSGVLNNAEDFFSFRSRRLDRRLDVQVNLLWTRLAVEYGEPLLVTVYGELLGGRYPHPAVPAVTGLSPVQCGVWYASDLAFVAFDIAISRVGQAPFFLDFAQARERCSRSGFLFVEPLAVGPFHECASFEIHFGSTLPARLGLPALDEPNLAEGVVIRPMVESGDPSERQMVKLKIPEFSEARYDNLGWKTGRAGGASSLSEGSEQVLRYELLANISPQRLANVVSKRGRVNPSDHQSCRELLQDFEADVIDALREDGHLLPTEELRLEFAAELHEAARELVVTFLREEARGARGLRP